VFSEHPRELKLLSKRLLSQRESFLLESAQNKKDFSLKNDYSLKKDNVNPSASRLNTNEGENSEMDKLKRESKNNSVGNLIITFNQEGIKKLIDSRRTNSVQFVKSLKKLRFKSGVSGKNHHENQDKKSIFKLTATKRNIMSAKIVNNKSSKL
jgi:hypothetical protein